MLPELEIPTSRSAKLTPLLERAAAALNERRDEVRYPFLQPVQIRVKGLESLTLNCFSRDISDSGLGVLSNVKLPLQEVTVTFTGEEPTSLTGRVVWTNPLVREWHTCGIEFTDK